MRGTIIVGERILNFSMTLIIGIETKDGLIIGSDGLAKVTLGYSQILSRPETDQPKIFQVAPKIVVGITGGMLNRIDSVINDIRASIRKSEPTSLTSLAKALEGYIPKMYADRLNHPDFGISFFIAGYVDDKTGVDEGKQMIFQHEGNIYHYADDEPWLVVGNNRKAYPYIEKHAAKDMPKDKAIKVIKDAIADTAKNENDVGGHTFIYQLSENGLMQIE